MANSSLQIGNSNWAIKKDNLLGYSKSGNRFFPIPITMTRASAGTRVNSAGLVETVELLGSEEITNGDFATADLSSFNTTYATQAIVSEELKVTLNTANGYGFSYVTFPAVIGRSYRVQVDAQQGTGSTTNVKHNSGITIANENNAGSWSYDEIGVATATSCAIRLQTYGASGDYAIFDNVSVKEVTRNNLARVDYTGFTSSLLAEPQRTNLITYSEDFSQGVWVKTDANIVSNFGISPSGNLDADKITFDTTNVQARAQVNLGGLTSGNEYNQSYYLKSLGSDVTLRIGTSGAVAGEFVDIIATSEWQRFDITTTASGTTEYPRFQNINGIINTEILVWGAQMEAGSYATSYIPTSGSTVTRVQDQYSKTGISDKINSEEGVLFFEASALVNGGVNRIISLSDGTNDNAIYVRFDNTASRFRGYGRGSGGSYTLITVNSIPQTDNNKIALVWDATNFRIWINGSERATTTINDLPVGMSTLNISSPTGSDDFYGKIKQLQVFKTALTDSELETLTT